MFENLTWDAILQQWPWFAAAGAVFVITVGLLIAIKPGSEGQTEILDAAVDNMGWIQTGRIDFSDPNAIGKLVLEVEETRSVTTPTGVDHRDIRWRSATVDEAKMVLESYNALRKLSKTAIFTVRAAARTQSIDRGERIDAELKDAASGQDMANATLVPQEVPQ